MCLLEYGVELADDTCLDIWLRQPNGEYMHPQGATLVLSRTERGERIVAKLIAAAELCLQAVSSPQALVPAVYALATR